VPAGALVAAFVTSAAPASASGYSDRLSYVFTASDDGNGGLCLDFSGNVVRNFQPVQIYWCNGTGAQKWVYDYTDRTVRLAENVGMCLDINSGQTSNGTTVDLYQCNGTGAQVWDALSSGSRAWINPQSGKCLDDTKWSTQPWTQLQIWDCTGAANQDWYIKLA